MKLTNKENHKRPYGDFEGANNTHGQRQCTATVVEVKLGDLQQEIPINVHHCLCFDCDNFTAGVGAKMPLPDQKQDGCKLKGNRGQ